MEAERVLLVTGGASGIGRASAQRLAKDGAAVMVADRDETGGVATVEEIAAAGGIARFTALDVSDEENVRASIAATLDAFGRLDGAINCAGVAQAAKQTHAIEASEWALTLAVNLTGMFHCIKHQIAAMLDQTGGGAIVAVSSAAAVKGLLNSADYCASKAGILGLVRGAAVDYAEQGIRINALLPGASDTPLAHRSSAANPALKGMLRVPMMRMSSPDEIAAAAVWLVSPDSSYVTGASICVDGGMTIA
ncbi:SDR family NAD(P)-dependent oxidoreductase [Flavisphingomonas formosensis]|uniref:SDR family NAD(P)-dependent oxidoreductase n=1 Tax=Flavisphingomonas formosensis TaxID=861534 RepID=UPI0012FAFBA6|nr:SDR family NAD(P)-dependent oxidoreductase [Sphingomonas formosensis]